MTKGGIIKMLNALKHEFSNYDLFKKLLQACIDRKAKRLGLSVHGQIETNGIQSTTYIATKLVVFYSKMGRMADARSVFDRMSERSVVSWTCLLSGYSQNGCPEEALEIFSSMHRDDVRGNQFTYGSCLRACVSLRCLKIGEQIQGCIQKGKLVDDLFVQSALIDLHSKCGKMEDAAYIFGSMAFADRDLVSWNSMLGGYAVQGFSGEALVLFRSMLLEGLIPDSFTFGSLIKACTGGGGGRNGTGTGIRVGAIHVFIIKQGLESHSVISGSLIDSYAKSGDVRAAYRVHENMKSKDAVSTTALIAGYARGGIFGEDSIGLFREAHRINRGGVDTVMLCSMLNVCANLARLDLGRQVHAFTAKLWSGSGDVAMSNALIDMYSKSGEIEDANRVFDEMEIRNVISWTSMIAGYGKHGLGHRAVALFKQMESDGSVRPNDVTFLSVMFACSHGGMSDEGLEYFNLMVNKYRMKPRAEHYCCAVDMFARGGRLEEAYGLLSEINVAPNASLWGAVLGACCTHGNMYMGEMAARRLMCMEPEKAVNYVVLGSLYAGAGLWDDVWRTRKMLELRRLRKETGRSSALCNVI